MAVGEDSPGDYEVREACRDRWARWDKRSRPVLCALGEYIMQCKGGEKVKAS